MKLITFAGPPSAGKTSIILKTLAHLKKQIKIGVIKFDALSTTDDLLYKEAGIPVQVGISGSLCPDHYFVSNIAHCFEWGIEQNLDLLITESAGLCNRCSPHIKNVLSISVVDNLAGINTPKKIGPLLKMADVVVITKGDIVSQAEREVFSFNVKLANPKAHILFVNGITGQGSFDLSHRLTEATATNEIEGEQLRFPMPSAICSYCSGTTVIGDRFSVGRRIIFREVN